jgi:hypothetical protein
MSTVVGDEQIFQLRAAVSRGPIFFRRDVMGWWHAVQRASFGLMFLAWDDQNRGLNEPHGARLTDGSAIAAGQI